MAKKITFHSYKGGAGRSSTTLNVLPYLVNALKADAAHPILLLDTDVDSAGMTYLLNKAEHFASKENVDVKKLLKGDVMFKTRHIDDVRSHEFLSRFLPVGELVGVENEAILFLGTNDRDPIDNNDIDGTSEELINRLAIFADNNEDIRAIVMDSASGSQTVANFATDFADTIVSCMRPTMQLRMGTFRYLTGRADRNQSQKIVLLPTVVPNTDVEIDGTFQREEALTMIQRGANKLEGRLVINTDFVKDDCFGINEVQRFKWLEGVLYKIDNEKGLVNEDEKLAASRYKKLAEILAEN